MNQIEKLIEVKNLKKWFWTGGVLFGKKEAVRAVDDVSLYIKKREVLGLVGESGCGKTTCGKVILKIVDPTAGSIYFDGHDITHLNPRGTLLLRDPFGSVSFLGSLRTGGLRRFLRIRALRFASPCFPNLPPMGHLKLILLRPTPHGLLHISRQWPQALVSQPLLGAVVPTLQLSFQTPEPSS